MLKILYLNTNSLGFNCLSIDENNLRRHKNNPFQSIVKQNEKHVELHFENFKNQHGKSYKSHYENIDRKNIFKQNLRFFKLIEIFNFFFNYFFISRYIESFNRQGLSYKLAVNHFADRSEEELKLLRGKRSVIQNKKGFYVEKPKAVKKNLPISWDWRKQGAVTPVKVIKRMLISLI